MARDLKDGKSTEYTEQPRHRGFVPSINTVSQDKMSMDLTSGEASGRILKKNVASASTEGSFN